jgi:hypothetical protein
VRRWLVRFLVALAILAVSMPPAFMLTIALLPLWSHIEATYGIESVGHSGPADWCFEMTYVLVVAIVAASFAVVMRSSKRARPQPDARFEIRIGANR